MLMLSRIKMCRQIGILALVCFLFAGCANGGKVITEVPYAELGAVTFPSTHWGMTPEEFFPAIGQSIDDFTIKESNEHGDKSVIYSSKAIPFRGETPMISAHFFTVRYDDKMSLVKVFLTYSDQTEEQFTKLCADFEKMSTEQSAKVQSPEVSDQGDSLEWTLTSTATVMDFSEEDKAKINRYAEYYYSQMGESPLVNSTGDIDYLRAFGAQTLSSVNAVYDKGSQSVQVTFSGSDFSNELGHLRAYEKLRADGILTKPLPSSSNK